ncbi:MAG: aldo/keto reductase [Bacteroidales bacterium]
MKEKITRRRFVQTGAAATAALAISPAISCSGQRSPYDSKGLPTVKLGGTGEEVPLMGFGCGSRWMSVEEDDKALEMLVYALENGLYYWDTAASYGNERLSSEERIGKILKQYRDRVFMVSKTEDRDADAAKRSIERTLDRLQTDHLNMMHVHSINSVEDAEQLGDKGKVLEVLHRYQDEGIIKHIGFTGHTTAAGMKRAAELYDFEVMMMALNHQVADGSENFEGLPAPYAMNKGMGVVAMKVIRPRETVEGLDAGDLIRYALTLKDFHMINVGIDNLDLLKANIETLRNFRPLDDQKMKEIRMALQPFYQGKNLAWMRHGYRDGWDHHLHLA